MTLHVDVKQQRSVRVLSSSSFGIILLMCTFVYHTVIGTPNELSSAKGERRRKTARATIELKLTYCQV